MCHPAPCASQKGVNPFLSLCLSPAISVAGCASAPLCLPPGDKIPCRLSNESFQAARIAEKVRFSLIVDSHGSPRRINLHPAHRIDRSLHDRFYCDHLINVRLEVSRDAPVGHKGKDEGKAKASGSGEEGTLLRQPGVFVKGVPQDRSREDSDHGNSEENHGAFEHSPGLEEDRDGVAHSSPCPVGYFDDQRGCPFRTVVAVLGS